LLHLLQTLHLRLELLDLVLQPQGLGFSDFGLRAVGRVHRRQVALDALLDLLHAPLDLGVDEVAVAVVHRLELAAVDGHDGLQEQIELATQRDELAASVAYRATVVAADVGDGLEVQRQPLGQPHELDIALGFALQASAGLDAVEVAVDVD